MLAARTREAEAERDIVAETCPSARGASVASWTAPQQ